MSQNQHPEPKEQKALVLLSGGLDSTVCLYIAIEEFGRRNVAALSIQYGQRHSKELTCAEKICGQIGVPHNIIRHDAIPPTMLTDASIEVPNVSYDEIEGVSPMYVPFRNGQMLSILAAHAQARDFQWVFFGAHAEDAANWAYPDCTPEFIGAMANAIYIGTYHQVRLNTPLMWWRKAEIVRAGSALGAPLRDTWSCYKGEQIHCGTCATCISRREAFDLSGIADPTEYASAYERKTDEVTT